MASVVNENFGYLYDYTDSCKTHRYANVFKRFMKYFIFELVPIISCVLCLLFAILYFVYIQEIDNAEFAPMFVTSSALLTVTGIILNIRTSFIYDNDNQVFITFNLCGQHLINVRIFKQFIWSVVISMFILLEFQSAALGFYSPSRLKYISIFGVMLSIINVFTLPLFHGF